MRVSFLTVLGLAFAPAAYAQSPPSIEGHWNCTDLCACAPIVRSDNTITQNGNDIHVINLCNDHADGKFQTGRQFWVNNVPKGSGTTLTLSMDGAELFWGHGSVWRRK